MRRRLSIASAMVAALALSTGAAAAWAAAQQPTPAAKEETKGKPAAKPSAKAAADKDRVDGTVESIDKPKGTVLVRLRPSGNLHQILLGSQTVYTVQNKAGSVEDVKTGSRVICLGQLNDKKQLVATRCDVRQPK